MKIAVLDNLRSVHNVGSIFRTCNAVGIEKIYLCGTTPTPVDKKGEKRKDFSKVALGAEDTVAWEYKEDTLALLQELHITGNYIIALEQDAKSVDYKTVKIDAHKNIIFVIGPEVTGMSEVVLKECDVIAEIPMLGSKESLNVTIAFGIGVYRILGL